MKRINQILKNKKYKIYLQKIEECETNREFCRHDMTHFLDVCRLGEIQRLNAEQKTASTDTAKVTTELVYAAGLLHDIGRFKEYESGVRHEIASAELAPEILRECGFNTEETEEICLAIGNHRNPAIKDNNSLSGFLYRADKMSRPCFICKNEARCDWSIEKKNLELKL